MNLRAWDHAYITRKMPLYDHAKFGDDRPNGLGVHKEHTHRQTDRRKPLIILKDDKKFNFLKKSNDNILTSPLAILFNILFLNICITMIFRVIA